ncbi:tRNA(Ile)-lysidine synthase [Amycolatopsis sp. NBRC 101858]|uniref:tRNA lysidine(34) synthetase TilS n=1 Tax=Amycolatopsis sp. NBRC 101858 TaxID=3032200 RepID=UPI0024A1F87F|nr:tRNA lysidine(34) synthetase TilS [Amycolatopsis sp. NBRC 101858]GLY35745.1 tRNA(Ile)-lysidine synthase [Amycolatopsis sp. NBRC 101858]
MTGPAVAAVRRAVRAFLETVEAPPELCVAVSGGADSLALAEATAYVGHHRGHHVRALVVDHGLQEGSAKIARDAAAAAKSLGADETEVRRVDVTGSGGPEAAARKARYGALAGHALVLLGHTLDDQAETVLLGLGRGSGPRSVAGMRPHDPPWGRPLLAVSRATTRSACAELGVEPWDDPHNAEPRFTRVRLRTEVLPLLEDVLNGGVAGALARTAAQLREDSEALDTMADMIFTRAGGSEGLDVGVLTAEPAAIRRRVIRRWLLQSGVRELTDAHLRAVDALVARWRGQGGVWLPGNLEARRCRGRLCVISQPTTRGE